MTGADWRLAWLVVRGQGHRVLLAVVALALSVAVCAGLGLVVVGIERVLVDQGRILLLGDLEVQGRQDLDADRLADLRAILPPDAQLQEVITTQTMARSAVHPRAQIVRVVGIDPVRFPFYGEVVTGQGSLADLASDRPTVLVQPALLQRLEVALGDNIRLGDLAFQIVGTIEELPGIGLGGFAIGPRILVHEQQLRDTGLLGRGSRSRHRQLVRLPDPGRADALVDQLIAQWQLPADARQRLGGAERRENDLLVRSSRDAGERVRRTMRRLEGMLALVTVLAGLLGLAGVIAAVRNLAQSQVGVVALLRCLGARRRRADGLLYRQLLVAAACALPLGLLLAHVLAWLALLALSQILPVGPAIVSDLPVILLAIGQVLVLAWLGSWSVLRSTAGAGPGELLRGIEARLQGRWSWTVWGVLGAAALGVLWLLGLGIGWSLLVLLALVLLTVLTATVLVAVARRVGDWCRSARPPWLRWIGHWLAWQPRRSALAMVPLTLALACAHLLVGYRSVLLADLSIEGGDTLPSLFATQLLDEDLAAFRLAIEQDHAGRVAAAPMVRARIRSIDAVLVADTPAEPESRRRLRLREQVLSWAAQPGPNDRIVAGAWMADPAVWEASLEEEYAERLGVGLGSRLRLAVMGQERDLVVTSIRRVDWSEFAPTFSILVEPEPFADDPRTWVASIGLPDSDAAGAVQADLAARFPEIPVFDIADVVQRLVGLLRLAEWTITALVVVLGALALVVVVAIQWLQVDERGQEGALLRLLGSSARQLRRALLGEALLRLLPCIAVAAFLGGGLAILVGGWFLERWTWPPLGQHLAVASCGLLLPLLGSWLVGRQLGRQSPMQIIRRG